MFEEKNVEINEKQDAVAAVDGPPRDLGELMAAAEKAESRYDHERAVALYTAALELSGITFEERYEALDGRLMVYRYWGDAAGYTKDLMSLVALARQMDDKRRLAEVMAVRGFLWNYSGIGSPPLEFIKEAHALAEELADDRILGSCLMMLGFHEWQAGNTDSAWDYMHQSLAAARLSGDVDLLLEITFLISMSHSSFHQHEEAQRFAAEARDLAATSGHAYKQWYAYLGSGAAETDLAAVRDYYEAAYRAQNVANSQKSTAESNSMMALLLWRLGLYSRAPSYAAAAVEKAEILGTMDRVGSHLETLGRVYLAKGLLDEAERAFQRGFELSAKEKNQQAYLAYGLAEVALARNLPGKAADHYQLALETFKSLELVALAGLGTAYLAQGRQNEALAQTTKAVESLDSRLVIDEFQAQEIWWRHYQVLQTMKDEAAFAALDMARLSMMAAIETLSDEGLRRNYLNKVAVNRQITLTWTAEAAKRGLPLLPFTAHEPLVGNLREQFRRVVEIGGRLAAQHDPAALADFIVDEFVEMSGAERVLLLLLDEEEYPQLAASFNPIDALALAEPLALARQPVLHQDVGTVPDGAVVELHQRSLIILPLISQGQLLGILYGDMRQIFGRFNESDVQLLGMLANQAAAALENAELVTTLEDKVEERTVELKSANERLAARNDELAIINGVQQAIAAELDLQSIFNIVGDKLSEIYGTDSIALWTYDGQSDMAFPRYYKESGKFANVEPQTPGPIGRLLLKKREPILLRTKSDYSALGHIQPAGTVPAQSGMYVPLIVGNEFIGVIYLFNFKTAAFDESDLRLLTTLANSMSITLENARLFNEARNARAEAEQANTAKSAFMSNMSHELRTPLNAIIGFTRIVKRKTKELIPKKQVSNLDKVQQSAEHLLGLINTVLDIAKIEAGQVDVINTRFHIGPLIELCTTTAQPLLKPGVELKQEFSSDLPAIFSDQDKVKQILLNLLSNAAKFTHKGEIVVSGEWRVASGESEDALLIQVVDTGIGMNEEQIGRVFEEFQQADASTTRQYGGTGLGLPISKQLANLLDGDLTAESAMGQGTTFTLSLPIGIVE